MYGTPPHKALGLYRGLAGKNINGGNMLDLPLQDQENCPELVAGTDVSGDHMTLRLDLSKFILPKSNSWTICMNEIVCNQPIDTTSRQETEYTEYAPYVFDSFNPGLSLLLSPTADLWNNQLNYMEPPYAPQNEHEDVAPPEANIVDWYFQVIVWQ